MPPAQVSVTVEVAASPERVWRALTSPAEVSQWDGVQPLSIPEGYPSPGQHARWSMRIGPVKLVLHDRITAAEPMSLLASTIDIAFVRLQERYTIDRTASGCHLVSDNQVSSRVPGLQRLARRFAQSNVEGSMARLKKFCERA